MALIAQVHDIDAHDVSDISSDLCKKLLRRARESDAWMKPEHALAAIKDTKKESYVFDHSGLRILS